MFYLISLKLSFILQVLHDCRQLVSWDVWLSPETGATLTFRKFYKQIIFHFQEIKNYFCFKSTVNDKLKEGKNEVKSMWP
jgi:hypothetical protein